MSLINVNILLAEGNIGLSLRKLSSLFGAIASPRLGGKVTCLALVTDYGAKSLPEFEEEVGYTLVCSLIYSAVTVHTGTSLDALSPQLRTLSNLHYYILLCMKSC